MLHIQKPADNWTADGLLERAGIAPATIWETNQPGARLVVEVEFNNASARDTQIIVSTLAHAARVQPFLVKPTAVSECGTCMTG